MRHIFLSCTLLVISIIAQAQSTMIEKFRDSLDREKTDTGKAIYGYKLSYYYQNYKPDSAWYFANASYTISKKVNFIRGKNSALGQMATALNRMGNYAKALEFYLEQLELLEKLKDPEDIASAYISIAMVYASQKDFQHALHYAYKADSLARAHDLTALTLYTTLDLGDIYTNNRQLDSALHYTTLCYAESFRQENDMITGTALNNLGNINLLKENYSEALDMFRNSTSYLNSTQDYNTLAECYLGMAQSFEKTEKYDSALHYAELSFHMASDNQFLKHAVQASNFLTQLYSKRNNINRAFTYQQAYIALKDSFVNKEKIQQMQNLTITEQVRQQQISEEELQAKKSRRLKTELLVIGMCIPLVFLFSAFLSGRKVHRKVVEFAGLFSLLFLFEYITFILHPVVVKMAGHSPVYEFMIFITIAAIISPSHHKVADWTLHKLTRRHHNKLIAAKTGAKK
jgi:tetratricopeptide (TPR) repeat protein